MSEKQRGNVSVSCLLASVLLAGWTASSSGGGESPRFRPVAASALMGSPDPLPLETEIAFPRLQFERPLEFTYAHDGTDRVFVVEQHGVIHVFANQADVARTDVFLDIQQVVSREGNEEGLLGLAFHPRYRENGEFFVYYSTRPRASVLSRFRVSPENPNRADRESEEELLRIPQPYSNHNGGSIKFGPDGFLYIGMGDGGSAHDPQGNGQSLETLLGKVLRIDVDRRSDGKRYAIPPDNPFVGQGPRVREEIWALGVRNIWRLGFDRETGDLWAGDVGQNRYEEIDLIVRGGNYGWKMREGKHPFEPQAARAGGPLIEPLVDYYHSEGRSVTGGLVYRGSRLPEYRGAYFYGDFVSGTVWVCRLDGANVIENRQVARTGLAISAFGEDQAGELYFTAFDGHLHRFRLREIDLEATRRAFPQRLSDTGLFADVAAHRPIAGAIPYDVNVPLWSDHAGKDRFFVLPRAAAVQFDERDAWEFPVGTVFVKTFALDLNRQHPGPSRRLETRLLVHAPEGWAGSTYLWNEAQTDATLLDGALTKTYAVQTADGVVQQEWYFPSRADCLTCHTPATKFVLGLNTRQMNRDLDYGAGPANQIEHLGGLGVFTRPLPAAERWEAYPRWGDRQAAAERLARAYLDVHCAMCHGPGGLRGQNPDLSFHTPLAKTGLLGRAPGQGRVGPEGSMLLTPGDAERSELYARMSLRGARQMPPLATSVIDGDALAVLHRWIKKKGTGVVSLDAASIR